MDQTNNEDLDNDQQSLIDEDEYYGDHNTNNSDTSEDIQDDITDTPGAKELLFISLVSKEPFLFNPNHEDYRKFCKKNMKWKKIGETVGWSEAHCKTKWKGFRDQYCRQLKKNKIKQNFKITWKYFKYLQFLRPYALVRKYRERQLSITVPSFIENTSAQLPSIPIIDNDLLPLTSITFPQVDANNWTYTTNCNNSCSSSTSSGNINTNEIPKENLQNPIDDSNQMQQQQQTRDKSLFSVIEDCMKEIHNEQAQEQEHQPQITQQTEQQIAVDTEEEDDDLLHTFLNIDSYFEKKLIVLVRQEDMLYNTKNPDYRNVKRKLEVWERISSKLRKSVKQCRAKWKALRDQFIREHKRLSVQKNSELMPKWRHYDALMFLQQFVKTRMIEYNFPKSLEVSPLISNDHNETVQEQCQHDVEKQQEVALNDCSNNSSSIQQSDDLCIGSVDDYDEMDIENYMLTERENEAEYGGEFPVINENCNNLATTLETIISSTTQLYHTEQTPQNDMQENQTVQNLNQQQDIVDKPLLKLKEFYKLPNNLIISTNSNNLTTFNSSTTIDHNISCQNSLNDDTNSTNSSSNINSTVIALDVSATSKTSTTPPPPPPAPANLDTTQDFFSNIIDSTIATTSSSGSELLEQNIDNSNVMKTVLNSENDEVGAFFKLMALKVRNANLTPVALTNLEIQILHVINSSLKQ